MTRRRPALHPLDRRRRIVALLANHLVEQLRVPHRVQPAPSPLEEHGRVIPAAIAPGEVQRLVHVADKMREEAQGKVAVRTAGREVSDSAR